MKIKAHQFHEGHQKKIRFLIAGIVNTLVGLASYPLLYIMLNPLEFSYIVVLIISQLLCVTFSFVSNKCFVFKTKGNLSKEYLKFFLFHGFYFCINLIALPVMVEFLKLNPMVAQTIFSIFIIVTSYFWHSTITFKVSGERTIE